jgi:hypothetical protein
MRRIAVTLLLLFLLGCSSPVKVASVRDPSPPATIASDCSTDVAPAINAWLATIPDGSTITFPSGACYRIDETLLLDSRHNLTIVGNGAIFRQVTAGDYARRAWAFVGGSNLSITGTVVQGANPNPGVYTAAYEGQSAYYVGGVDTMTITAVQATNPYGDFVQIINSNNCKGCPAGPAVFAKHVTVTGSTFTGAGRQGVSVTAGSDVLISGNTLDKVGRSMFDIEPTKNTASWGAERVTISGNTTGTAHLLWLACAGEGPDVQDIVVEHNTATGATGTPLISVATPAGEGLRHRFTIRYNTWASVSGSPAPGFRFNNVESIVLAGNAASFPAGRSMTAIGLIGTWHTAAFDNSFPGAAQAWVSDGTDHDTAVWTDTAP